MLETIAENIITFNQNLTYVGKLPKGFKVMNPFVENPETMDVMRKFYHQYYNDNQKRKFIIGINPSRHGAGITGVPFTDTKRLDSICGIKMKSAKTHEVSSVFLYDMIMAYGGAKSFYGQFYINSPFPLAIIRKSDNGSWLNANYYDDKQLFEMVKDFMIESLKKHIELGLDCEEVYVLGTKNANFIHKLNKEEKLFDSIVPLEHPRYIQQYKSKEKQQFIDKYILTLSRRLIVEE
ncbi:MAG: SMUG2 DNA glycosylase family protein [Bacteroidia bacterium]|nr:SMUG2 DNA glycosylase family protein [Bacteroidia bacterium]MCO5253416.1 SMUG2 DNA glycosylase family protein [Bacteroidota bacterium]